MLGIEQTFWNKFQVHKMFLFPFFSFLVFKHVIDTCVCFYCLSNANNYKIFNFGLCVGT